MLSQCPPATPVLVVSALTLLAEGVLSPSDAVRAQRQAFGAAKRDVPARLLMANPDLLGPGNVTLVKPACLGISNPNTEENETYTAMGLKVVSVRDRNPADFGLPGVVGAIVMADARTGLPTAVLDGTLLTAMRTAAGSAACFEEFLDACTALPPNLQEAITAVRARRDVSNGEAGEHLAILGCGLQGLAHAGVLSRIRHFTAGNGNYGVRSVTFLARQEAKARDTAAAFAAATDGWGGASLQAAGVRISGASSESEEGRQILRCASVIACCTSSSTPVLTGELVQPGALVCAVGTYKPADRELDDSLIARCLIVPDCEGAKATSGDLCIPLASDVVPVTEQTHIVGVMRDAVVSTLAKLLEQRAGSLSTTCDVFLFKSVGTAEQDIATASVVVDNCKKGKIGTFVNL